jgi:hypothetical protein
LYSKKVQKIKEDGWVQEDPVVCYFYPCFSIIKEYKKIKEDGWVQEDPVVCYFYPCLSIIK